MAGHAGLHPSSTTWRPHAAPVGSYEDKGLRLTCRTPAESDRRVAAGMRGFLAEEDTENG